MILSFPAENPPRNNRRFILFIATPLMILTMSPALIPAHAQPVPQIKPQAQKMTLQQILEQQAESEPITKQGRRLGEIKEESPLLPPPRPQNFAPAAPQLQFAPAKPQPAPSTAIIIGTYPLNEALLAKLEKIHAEILKLPDTDDDTENDISGGIDVLVKAMEKRSDIMEILGRHLMNARDYVTAMQAVSNALAQASGAGEAQIFGENNKISSENLAFGKKYADRIRNLLEE